MSSVGTGPRLSRSLRLRLTLSYALFFTLLLALLALVLRQFLAQTLDSQIRGALDQDWATLKGYLHVGKGQPHWYVDQTDPDEVALEGRLHRIFFLADSKGNTMDVSDLYRSLGVDPKTQIRDVVSGKKTIWQEKVDSKGEHFLIRASYDNDEDIPDRTYYYVAIGRSLKDNRKILASFTWLGAGLIPLIALGGCLIGWIYAGRALSPVMEIARAAQRIGGSNLSMRIPTRRTGDELDYLIETFNRMIERLELSFAQIRQFSTDVSHELRTPITIIRGQLEVALFTANSAEEYREAIADSLHDIERLSGIVRALLLLSQAETGQVVLQRSDLDVCALLIDLVDQFQIPAESAQVKISFDGSNEECHADLDRVQFERMISNLLSNALKFTPAGGQVHVALQTIGQTVGQAAGDELVIRISDTGRGIAAEHLPHIFDRFYRVSAPSVESSPEKGLGLGLSFVAWIASAHGGSVEAVSKPGEGSTFTVRLPRHSAQSSAPPAKTHQHHPELKQV